MALRAIFAARLHSRLSGCRSASSVIKSTSIRTLYTGVSPILKSSAQSSLIPVRRAGGGHAAYRCVPPEDPFVEMVADLLMTLVWCYLFWKFYHDGGILINYGVDYIDYSTYTDEQLGIEEEIEE